MPDLHARVRLRASWERFAQRATAGDWELNGEETAARRRSDVTPETPVRKMEKLD